MKQSMLVWVTAAITLASYSRPVKADQDRTTITSDYHNGAGHQHNGGGPESSYSLNESGREHGIMYEDSYGGTSIESHDKRAVLGKGAGPQPKTLDSSDDHRNYGSEILEPAHDRQSRVDAAPGDTIADRAEADRTVDSNGHFVYHQDGLKAHCDDKTHKCSYTVHSHDADHLKHHHENGSYSKHATAAIEQDKDSWTYRSPDYASEASSPASAHTKRGQNGMSRQYDDSRPQGESARHATGSSGHVPYDHRLTTSKIDGHSSHGGDPFVASEYDSDYRHDTSSDTITHDKETLSWHHKRQEHSGRPRHGGSAVGLGSFNSYNPSTPEHGYEDAQVQQDRSGHDGNAHFSVSGHYTSHDRQDTSYTFKNEHDKRAVEHGQPGHAYSGASLDFTDGYNSHKPQDSSYGFTGHHAQRHGQSGHAEPFEYSFEGHYDSRHPEKSTYEIEYETKHGKHAHKEHVVVKDARVWHGKRALQHGQPGHAEPSDVTFSDSTSYHDGTFGHGGSYSHSETFKERPHSKRDAHHYDIFEVDEHHHHHHHDTHEDGKYREHVEKCRLDGENDGRLLFDCQSSSKHTMIKVHKKHNGKPGSLSQGHSSLAGVLGAIA
ncbi:uncharacterized protein L969DRAFT_84549 [Mixia osmundae IAM 14324]|uniref:Uncharacterized protein n=1 Tax=Mixia osmundae (strain CBS 9802 / IAM 14324 / JCM 22182 / KY 12970) TaxID=764103 RepID=G7E559_MIXOS|nr:uncharacterized protein L969DRAFT_84549 [Mixia osmundae IAM 14324]KEI42674.1 hypothetical protein L969DRAFT_84549 [Mixia osmundae IAM 14324]GAA97969.1 hypothetical protein E5Q_04649 [Mixia osmundae IAM 14324]